MNTIITAFNDHFKAFIDDIHAVFPEDADILSTKNTLSVIRKANPKMIVKIWNKYIVSNYKSEIEAGDLDFFINKDYSDDLAVSQNSGKIMDSINRLREPIRNMGADNQEKVLRYIQNLTKLAELYESNKIK
tara:strand:- start:69 stop:464 length:396 start_codon:yes stop_codon:yes gene_type:complete